MAHEVSLDGDQAAADCSFRFSRATKLVLRNISAQHCHLTMADLNRIVPLTQITQFSVQWKLDLANLIELLSHVPNVTSLTLFAMPRLPSNKDEIIPLISNSNNKITKLFVEGYCTFESPEILVTLFPRMGRIMLGIVKDDLASSIRFLFSENRHQLFWVCDWNGDRAMAEQIQAIIDCEKLIDDYSMKLIGRYLYFWW